MVCVRGRNQGAAGIAGGRVRPDRNASERLGTEQAGRRESCKDTTTYFVKSSHLRFFETYCPSISRSRCMMRGCWRMTLVAAGCRHSRESDPISWYDGKTKAEIGRRTDSIRTLAAQLGAFHTLFGVDEAKEWCELANSR